MVLDAASLSNFVIHDSCLKMAQTLPSREIYSAVFCGKPIPNASEFSSLASLGVIATTTGLHLRRLEKAQSLSTKLRLLVLLLCFLWACASGFRPAVTRVLVELMISNLNQRLSLRWPRCVQTGFAAACCLIICPSWCASSGFVSGWVIALMASGFKLSYWSFNVLSLCICAALVPAINQAPILLSFASWIIAPILLLPVVSALILGVAFTYFEELLNQFWIVTSLIADRLLRSSLGDSLRFPACVVPLGPISCTVVAALNILLYCHEIREKRKRWN